MLSESSAELWEELKSLDSDLQPVHTLQVSKEQRNKLRKKERKRRNQTQKPVLNLHLNVHTHTHTHWIFPSRLEANTERLLQSNEVY